MRTITGESAVIVNIEKYVGDVEQGPLRQRGIFWQRNHIVFMSRSARVAESMEEGRLNRGPFCGDSEIDEKATAT
jgi:hypothetical protein